MITIQILGTGCPKCKTLTEHAERAAKSLGTDYKLEKVTDVNDIMKFGVMLTPALAINGKVKSVGKVLLPEEIMALLK